MPNKSSAPPQSGKTVTLGAEAIWRKPLTERQEETLEAVAARQNGGDESSIDFTGIPALSDKQLRQFKRSPKK